jgi:hypothetical protein
MGKCAGLAVLVLVLSVLVPPPPAAAGSTLTNAEVEAVLHATVSRTVEQDLVIDKGPYQGETQSGCFWVTSGPAPATVGVGIIRAPRTPQEREAGLAMLREAFDKLKQKGWTIESATTGGASCSRAVPPAGEASARPATGCFMESKGLAFSVTVMGSANVTIPQVADLAGKVASRLP